MAHSPLHPRPVVATPAADDSHALSAELEGAVERFRRMIASVGQRHGLSENEIDEVMQEVRLRLWRNRGEVETLRSVGASYVYRTAVSAALDIIRARRARRTGLDAVLPLDGLDVVATQDATAEVEDRELADRVMAAVDQLATNRRPVVRMHLAGYEREEIARALGWSVGKVRNLLSRGLADLRAELAAGPFNAGGDR